jgi:hypothetical protein
MITKLHGRRPCLSLNMQEGLGLFLNNPLGECHRVEARIPVSLIIIATAADHIDKSLPFSVCCSLCTRQPSFLYCRLIMECVQDRDVSRENAHYIAFYIAQSIRYTARYTSKAICPPPPKSIPGREALIV